MNIAFFIHLLYTFSRYFINTIMHEDYAQPIPVVPDLDNQPPEESFPHQLIVHPVEGTYFDSSVGTIVYRSITALPEGSSDQRSFISVTKIDKHVDHPIRSLIVIYSNDQLVSIIASERQRDVTKAIGKQLRDPFPYANDMVAYTNDNGKRTLTLNGEAVTDQKDVNALCKLLQSRARAVISFYTGDESPLPTTDL